MIENIKPIEEGEEFVSIDEAIKRIDKYNPPAEDKQRVKDNNGSINLGDAVELKNITLYHPDNSPIVTYDKVIIPFSCVKKNGRRVNRYYESWDKYFADSESTWMSFALFYHAAEWVWKNPEKPEAKELKKQLRSDLRAVLLFGTTCSYRIGTNKVGHRDRLGEISVPIPHGNERLFEVGNSDKWRPFLDVLCGRNVPQLASVLEYLTEKDPLIRTSEGAGQRIVSTSCTDSLFRISCNKYKTAARGRAREVYIKGINHPK